MISIVDIIIRFLLQSAAIDYSGIQIVVINVLGLLIQIVLFVYGLVNAIRGTLSPKRMGVVIAAYFVALCITDSAENLRDTTWQLIAVVVMLIISSVLGAIASFFYFVSGKNNRALPLLILIISLWGITRMVIAYYVMIRYAGQFVSMNTA